VLRSIPNFLNILSMTFVDRERLVRDLLRQSSPFAGALDEPTRRRVLDIVAPPRRAERSGLPDGRA
jgi:hypothetical protein